MILDGQTVDYILYLCCDKKSFYQIVQEAIDLINSSESSEKTKVDTDLFAAETVGADEEVDFD